MTPIRWRWEEKDFGFRFKSGKGKNTAEYYQASKPEEFYIVPPSQRKHELTKEQLVALTEGVTIPTAPQVIANPWSNYDLHCDWIESADGICLNYAGCLHQEEIVRREDEGVGRAREFVLGLLNRSNPAPITVPLIRQIHREFMGDIYPFAGEWRTVGLHKGDGPMKWRLPPCGIQPMMDDFGQSVLSKTPFFSDNNESIYEFVSEVMNEFLAIHPFREGNGRTAFMLGDLLLLQNNLLPLTEYDPQHQEQEAYYAACEAGRLKKDYMPLATLIARWEETVMLSWEGIADEQ
jgi:cell filamentation protein